MATAIVPGIYDAMLADVAAEIETEAAYAMARRMAREEGILLGISGGAALAVAERTAREVPAGRDAVIVAVLPDSGSRYLSDRFWDETD